MQVYEWVTAMSLTHDPLNTWMGDCYHPAASPLERPSKRLKGLPPSSTDLSRQTPGTAKAELLRCNPPDASESIGNSRAALALHADAASASPGFFLHQGDRQLMAAEKFAIDHVTGVAAVGRTGAVYRARYIVCFSAQYGVHAE